MELRIITSRDLANFGSMILLNKKKRVCKKQQEGSTVTMSETRFSIRQRGPQTLPESLTWFGSCINYLHF